MDVDFDYFRRHEVIEYITEKYGADHVAKIGTYTTMSSKLVLKDVGRIVGVDHNLINDWNKELPSTNGNVMDLSDAVEELPVFKQARQEYPELFDLALDLQSMPRGSGVHACFDENTKVITDSKIKYIKDIKPGDKVLTHKRRYREVKDLIKNPADEMYTVSIFQTEDTKVTANHPYWTASIEKMDLGIKKEGRSVVSYQLGRPTWKPVDMLDPFNDYVLAPFGKSEKEQWPGDSSQQKPFYNIEGNVWLQVEGIKKETKKQIVYNLYVEEDHSYTANGIAVKNCGVQIAPVELSKSIPLRKGKEEGEVVTQYEGPNLESLGFKLTGSSKSR